LRKLALCILGVWTVAALAVSCADPQRQADPAIGYLSSPEWEAFDLPFSEAVRVGNTIYLSGQLGITPGTTELVPGGVAEETRQTMENIRAVLQRHGSGLDRVVKCTIFLADIAEWPSMSEVYATYFRDKKPARSADAGSGLALGARVEIDCVAVGCAGGGARQPLHSDDGGGRR
jgi:reactive intermediate/imine deaminase